MHDVRRSIIINQCLQCVRIYFAFPEFAHVIFHLCITLNRFDNSINLRNGIEWQTHFTAAHVYRFSFPPPFSHDSIAIRSTLWLLLKKKAFTSRFCSIVETKYISTTGFIINRIVILWMKPALNNSHFTNHKWAHPAKWVPAACFCSLRCTVCMACVSIRICILSGSPSSNFEKQ